MLRTAGQVHLGAFHASHGIIGLDTVQVLHARPLSMKVLGELNAMTGGCRSLPSHSPYGCGFVINGKPARYKWLTRIQNCPVEALDRLQRTQSDAPCLLTQWHLAGDLYFPSDHALRWSWTSIERHAFQRLTRALDSRNYANGSYVGLTSKTRRLCVYWKQPLVLRVEFRFPTTQGVKALLKRCDVPIGDHVPHTVLHGLDLVDIFWRHLDFRTLNEVRVGCAFASRTVRNFGPQTYAYDVHGRALGTILRLAAYAHCQDFGGTSDGCLSQEDLTVRMLWQTLRAYSPRPTPRFFDRLDPVSVGFPDKSMLTVGQLIA